MFEEQSRVDTEARNGKGVVSESDQVVVTRKIGRPVDFEIAGEKFHISPPSFVVADIVSDLVHDARETILADGDKKLKSFEGLKNKKKSYDKNMFLGIQLILFDSRIPEWFQKHDDLPSQEELDKVMTVFRLKRCNRDELDNLLKTFKQLSDPSLPRTSFLSLASLMQ